MKAEKEIQQLRDAYAVLVKQPCQCAAEGHNIQCQIGGKMMEQQIKMLDWILGKVSGDFDRHVETFVRAAREVTK